jgi:hypothetical protein
MSKTIIYIIACLNCMLVLAAELPSNLAEKTDHWYQLSAATVRVVPFIRRAIAYGINDPYFPKNAVEIADEINELSLRGDSLKAAWQQSKEASAEQQIKGIIEIQKNLKNLEEQARSAPSLSPKGSVQKKVDNLVEVGIENVPKEVLLTIVKRAKQTADDFLQESIIEAEARDYLRIEAFRSNDELPVNVREKMLARAARKHPQSWRLMWDEINGLFQGYQTITSWEKDGVPGIEKSKSLELIKAAKAAYPDDWTMMVYEVNQSADSKP